VAESVGVEPAKREHRFALLFEGYIRAPRAGRYTFHLGSDDGSMLYLDGEQLIDHDGPHALSFKSAEAELGTDPVPIRIAYAQDRAGRKLVLRWEGPEMDKQEIAARHLLHRPADENEAATPQ
jgi:hypothetical protein